MARFGQAGVLMAIAPMGIAQSVRFEHDRAMYAHLRENRTWQGFAVVYYLVLLVVTIAATLQGVRIMDLPLVILILMIMCPFLFIMVYGDIKNCMPVR